MNEIYVLITKCIDSQFMSEIKNAMPGSIFCLFPMAFFPAYFIGIKPSIFMALNGDGCLEISLTVY